MFPPFDPERDERRRRPTVFARGQVPVRVLIPSIFTLIGLCAGLTAIRMGIEHRWDLAVAALVFAALLDGIVRARFPQRAGPQSKPFRVAAPDVRGDDPAAAADGLLIALAVEKASCGRGRASQG